MVGNIRAPFRETGYPYVWSAGLGLSFARWLSLFLGTYYLTVTTGSAALIDLGGATYFAPTLLTGPVVGRLSDRRDRRMLCVTFVAVTMALSVGFSVLFATGAPGTGAVFAFLAVAGLISPVNMTVRLALAHDLVGEPVAQSTMAVEAGAVAIGSLLGPLLGGVVLHVGGISAAFWLVPVLLAWSLISLVQAPSPPAIRRDIVSEPAAVPADAGLMPSPSGVWRVRPLTSVLGVSLVFNICFFTYIPLVPLIGRRLDAAPALVGLLVAAGGIGNVVGCALLAHRRSRHVYRTYIRGCALALFGLAVFSQMHWYPLAFVALVVAGLGQAGFGTNQSLLVMKAVRRELKGSAMGAMSATIGVQPLALLATGAIAEWLGASTTTLAMSIAGIVLIAVWVSVRPELRERA